MAKKQDAAPVEPEVVPEAAPVEALVEAPAVVAFVGDAGYLYLHPGIGYPGTAFVRFGEDGRLVTDDAAVVAAVRTYIGQGGSVKEV
jgi:hypothetical protein